MTELRKFGILFSTIFFVISICFISNNNLLASVFLVLSFFFIFITFFYEGLLNWLFKKWMRFAELLSRIATPLIFLLLYICVFIPLGMISKAYNKIYTSKNKKKTYWELRGDVKPDSDMKDQF
jgi:hypothetical protein